MGSKNSRGSAPTPRKVGSQRTVTQGKGSGNAGAEPPSLYSRCFFCEGLAGDGYNIWHRPGAHLSSWRLRNMVQAVDLFETIALDGVVVEYRRGGEALAVKRRNEKLS